MNLKECLFCPHELRYLGYIINESGLQVDPAKVVFIQKIPNPCLSSQLQRVVGVTS